MSSRKVLLFFLLLFLACCCLHAQVAPAYKKNSFGIDMIKLGINECIISVEHHFSQRRSLELKAGLIYANSYLEKKTEDWTNSHIFSESGFSARAGYRMYTKQVQGSDWTSYIEPVLMYKYLYYNNHWFSYQQTNPKNGETYKECIYQNRERSKFGLEFIWGREFRGGNTFSFDFFWGVGLQATSVARQDVLKQDTCDVSKIYEVDKSIVKSFYVRPTLTGGIIFRFSF